MRRILGSLLVAGLFVTGAAGCSSDDSDGSKADTPTTEAPSSDTPSSDAPSSDGGDGGGEVASGDADVQAYCDAVDEYAEKAAGPGTYEEKAAALAAESDELAETSRALATADLTADDAEALAACTQEAAEALLPGSAPG